MLEEKMEKALNGQINAELYSSYLYLSMSAWFRTQDLPGFANWMRVQAQEELAHAMKFFDYVAERGGRARLAAIEAPEKEWASPQDAFEQVAAHERKVTGLIHGLVDLAQETKDHAANLFLQWFVEEQVEEEASASEVLAQAKRAADGAAVYMLDRELGARVFTPPAEEST
jgi:ferritin